MSRLTKSLREAMLKTIISHAFDAKVKAAEQARIVAGEKIYSDIYGKHLIAMESLPKGFLPKSSHFYIAVSGQSHIVYLAETKLIGYRHGERSYYDKAKLYVGDEPVVEGFLNVVNQLDSLKDQREKMEREITPILESVYTFKKLFEVWPESKALLEKFEEKPTIAILPAVQVQKLNIALGLPVTEVNS
ncbi:Nmad5 family putative nucleotide modification protein [Acinetobacter beijerinckii]|uniref:Nmad5 family putative nucleotide modification protein n=1 Tax=Acinetobacter beijerinckii TaxID=262668 RepID=UPI002405A22A|nr:Nmad5 family putative nucleotide modification protein [Acinetobacter beijerinckii]